MKRKRKKKNLKEKNDYFYEEEEQDGEFYYIAGYTSNGVAFGITWEAAFMDGIIDKIKGTDILSLAMDMAIILLNESIEAFQYADDSDGDIGMLIG